MVEEESLEFRGREEGMMNEETTTQEDIAENESSINDSTDDASSEDGLSSVETSQETSGFKRVDVPPGFDPEIPVEHKQRGTCVVCGNPAQHGRSFYCDAHVALSPTLNKGTGLKRPRTPQDEAKLLERGKKQRLVNLILNNNDTIVGVQCFLLQVPDEWKDKLVATAIVQNEKGEQKEVKFWEPILTEQLAVSKREAEFVAGALIKFAESPQAKLFAGVASTLTPYVEILGALGFVGYRLMKLDKMRKDVEMVKALRDQSLQQNTLANQGQVPFPQSENGQESLYEDDEEASLRVAVNEG